MTQEEKAKAYDEAMERYKAKRDYESKEVHEFIEYLFLELKENEDERIRKSLIELLKADGECHTKEIDWLIRQKEQIILKRDLLSSLRAHVAREWDFSKNPRLKKEIDECFGKHFNLPFTEESVITVSDLLRCVNHFYEFGKNEQQNWKPTENQLKALDIAIRCGINPSTWEGDALRSLLEQLKEM